MATKHRAEIFAAASAYGSGRSNRVRLH